MSEGRLNASSIPVITAEPSEIVCCPLMRNFCIIHSKRMQEATETNVSANALNPKKYMPTNNAGTNAITTFHIIDFVVSLL